MTSAKIFTTEDAGDTEFQNRSLQEKPLTAKIAKKTAKVAKPTARNKAETGEDARPSIELNTE